MDHRLSAGITLLIAVTFLAGPLRAQEGQAVPLPPEMVLHPEAVEMDSPYAAEPYPAYPEGWVPAPQKRPHWNGPICKCLHSLCCWSSINCYCCGNPHSECTYIFGSCKAFFGEPCLKGPPRTLVPEGYAPYPPPSLVPSVYGPSGTGPTGCCNR